MIHMVSTMFMVHPITNLISKEPKLNSQALIYVVTIVHIRLFLELIVFTALTNQAVNTAVELMFDSECGIKIRIVLLIL